MIGYLVRRVVLTVIWLVLVPAVLLYLWWEIGVRGILIVLAVLLAARATWRAAVGDAGTEVRDRWGGGDGEDGG